ncbi:hypothetical protein [Corynebacterium glyciniphilum]|uniref:hypothetical protein n=1 Tax=Corynebacterium glyciniphilum TaxID=1404244 RepID=UPI0016433FFD|nr:hypothetical protein [Corynebacterium glyciniphilum]
MGGERKDVGRVGGGGIVLGVVVEGVGVVEVGVVGGVVEEKGTGEVVMVGWMEEEGVGES